ncbi:DNA polymerase I, partial [Massilia sp. CCM 8734]|nr:DNA polymerase I [Massilia sp. CCM 8734]
IEANKEKGILSKKLATIIIDCDVVFNETDYELTRPDIEKTDAIFQELEFRRMAEQFDNLFKTGGTSTANEAPDAKLYKKPQPKNEDQFDLFGSATSDEN